MSPNMTIVTQNMAMKERLWIIRVASEIVFCSHPDAGATVARYACRCSCEEHNFHLGNKQVDVTDGMQSLRIQRKAWLNSAYVLMVLGANAPG